MRFIRRLARLHRAALFWSLAGVSLLIAHDAVFLVQIGPGAALTRVLRGGGHAYWELASLVLIAAFALVALGTALRLVDLRRRARSSSKPAPTTATSSRAAGTLALWVRLLAVVAVGFAFQENVEHLLQHGHAPGIGALHGPEYPLAIPVLALVTLVGALVGAALLGIEQELLATIAALAQGAIRAPRRALRPPLELLIDHRSPLAHRAAGRAPPTRFATASIA